MARLMAQLKAAEARAAEAEAAVANAKTREVAAPKGDVHPKQEALKLCVYNYKGGVGKTTMTVNTGAALAKANKKVLLIDLDPQCNTTQFFKAGSNVQTVTFDDGEVSLDGMLPPDGENKLDHDRLDPTCHASKIDAFVEEIGSKPLYSIFKNFFAGEPETMNDLLNRDDTIRNVGKEADLLDVDGSKSGVRGAVLHKGEDFYNGRLWLLEGSPLMHEFEQRLARAFENYAEDDSTKRIGLMTYLMNRL